jgi:hypothetical protein
MLKSSGYSEQGGGQQGRHDGGHHPEAALRARGSAGRPEQRRLPFCVMPER